MFAGVGGVGAAFIRGGLASGTALDLSLGGALHDVTSDIGFAAFLIAALELVPFGVAVIGLPCSTFVFLSRGTSKRHRTNHWLGDVSRSDVRAANIIAERVVVICKVLMLRLCQFIVEQPLTSCFFNLLCWQRFVRLTPSITRGRVFLRMVRRCVWMGHWGHKTPKPTILWGCAIALTGLVCTRPARSLGSAILVKATTTKVVRKGNKFVKVFRIYGLKKELRATQAYPRRFCDDLYALSSLHLKCPLACFRIL